MTLAEKLLLGAGASTELSPCLEFVSSTPMTITPNYTNTGVTLQYSLNGLTWTTIASGETTPSANIIYFRGRATGTKSLFTSNSTSNAWVFTGATNLEVNGDITMLIQDILGGKVSDVPLATYCYHNMFYNCTSLVKAPDLPATTLADNCYQGMLEGCTGLTTAPVLPATTLANNCYQGMLGNCSKLTTPPVLPATTLAPSCYRYMFNSCTSLTTAPALPATTLASGCYDSMFNGCSRIKISTTKVGSYNNEYRVPTVGTGIDSANTMVNMFNNTGGTFTGTPTINTTYYTENTIV